MRRVCIHGYGKALDISEERIPENGGFYVFDEDYVGGDCHPFVWALDCPRTRWSSLNPWEQLRLYWNEGAAIRSEETMARLARFLEEIEPEEIICHSMGAQLLMNTLQTYQLPTTVRRIVLVQADIDRNHIIEHLVDVAVLNVWCWWDLALVSSMILNWRVPAGLIGWEIPNVHNRFFALRKGPNFHQDVWRDARIKALIDGWGEDVGGLGRIDSF